MFGFFKSKKQKRAKDLLGTAYKVYNYRCDVVAESDAKSLAASIEKLEGLIDDGKVGTEEYEKCADALEKLMRKCGGTIYPLSSWADYTDMIVVAGILAIGIRSFFLQPFKIPTNSMYPSFYGMTSVVYNGNDATPPPNLPEKICALRLSPPTTTRSQPPKAASCLWKSTRRRACAGAECLHRRCAPLKSTLCGRRTSASTRFS